MKDFAKLFVGQKINMMGNSDYHYAGKGDESFGNSNEPSHLVIRLENGNIIEKQIYSYEEKTTNCIRGFMGTRQVPITDRKYQVYKQLLEAAQ